MSLHIFFKGILHHWKNTLFTNNRVKHYCIMGYDGVRQLNKAHGPFYVILLKYPGIKGCIINIHLNYQKLLWISHISPLQDLCTAQNRPFSSPHRWRLGLGHQWWKQTFEGVNELLKLSWGHCVFCLLLKPAGYLLNDAILWMPNTYWIMEGRRHLVLNRLITNQTLVQCCCVTRLYKIMVNNYSKNLGET